MRAGLLRSLVGAAALALAGSAGAAETPVVVAGAGAPGAPPRRPVGGARVTVNALIPPGVDSHTYEPVPSDASLLSRADIIIANGLHLETSILALADSVRRAETPLVLLGDRALGRDEWQFDFSFPQEAGNPNPHLWMSVMLAMRYAELIRNALVEADPAHRDIYEDNTVALMAELSRLDATIFACVATIPPDRRKLVTYHDAFAYFAARYGMEVIAAVQPADFAEPSAQDVAGIIEQVRALAIPAIFGSEVFPSTVLEQIARESGAAYVVEVRDDELPGAPGEADHSYLGMMVHNVRAITAALGGDPACLDGLRS
jgi:zinc/manganese transport system substrate-binding protein/manganese/iron transport system substrate-binding protein